MQVGYRDFRLHISDLFRCLLYILFLNSKLAYVADLSRFFLLFVYLYFMTFALDFFPIGVEILSFVAFP